MCFPKRYEVEAINIVLGVSMYNVLWFCSTVVIICEVIVCMGVQLPSVEPSFFLDFTPPLQVENAEFPYLH